MAMNTIGIVGGMGSYATSYFFRKIIDSFPAEKEWDRPRIVIDNNCVMPSRVRAILYNESVDELVDALSKSVNGLVSLGCDKVVLACITSHYFLKRLRIERPDLFEFINLIQSTVSSIKEREVYICCTEGTTQTKLWNDYFDEGVTLIYPTDKELKTIRIFIEAVKQNTITSEIIEEFADFIEKASSQCVVLGCTELPVLYDLAKVHLKSSTKRIYNPLQCGINLLKEKLDK